MMKLTRKFMNPVAGLCLALTWLAADAQPVALEQCRVLADGQARLLCYDGWVDAQVVARKVPSQVAPAVAAAAPAAASFGLEQQARKAEAQEIDSEISGLFEGWGPKQVIKLNNGQLWQITDDSSAVLYLKNPKVKVRRSVLGYFVLEFEASTQTAKVRRLER
jgi:hypothetical protein